MLVTLKEVLDMAQKDSFAVPAFNVYNMETVTGAIQAAEEAKAPVILQAYARLFKDGSAYYLAPLILAAAKKASVPVCFHLDHGPSGLEVARAMYWGATGIMFDGSLLDFEDNIAQTKAVAKECGYAGVWVEGELGHIGSVNDDSMEEFTNVEEAARFVRETGVAALAVLVGNAHGRYKRPPKLDICRIAAIYEATDHTPLVLHGGSGIPDDQIRLAVQAGIRKMNFGTDVCYSFLDAVQEEINAPDRSVALDLFMRKPVESVKNFCLTKIKLL
ncbi:MAG: class II fructose-bisphosphate aldolase, partial [Lachnospiraceae bacterium]|nr:class II fructose-bisphosphate aldolase [Lachnospiraceae bacterium]